MSSDETAIPDEAIQAAAEWLKEWAWEEGDTDVWQDFIPEARDLLERLAPSLRRHIAAEIEAVAPDAVQVPTTLNHLTQQAERSGYFAAARVVREDDT